jgi:anaerobic ribonucleoside-triphosphate reductase activating protein
LVLGGLVPFSTVDFPGKLSAVLFTQGCSLRCRYCQNAHLRSRRANAALTWAAALAWLGKRRGLLDAVVFSGGEPTLQLGLTDAVAEVRGMGFAIGLHSAGTHPERLAQVLKLLDWVGFDVKAPLARYPAITGDARSGHLAWSALGAVLSSGTSYELRTTVHPALLSPEDLLELAAELQARGVGRWVLQAFRPLGCSDAALLEPCAPYQFDTLLPSLRRLVPEIVLR